MEIHTIGIDLGKTVFHLVGLNARGEVVVRKKCSRDQILRFTANLRVTLRALPRVVRRSAKLGYVSIAEKKKHIRVRSLVFDRVKLCLEYLGIPGLRIETRGTASLR